MINQERDVNTPLQYVIKDPSLNIRYSKKTDMWGRGGVVVSALEFRSEGRWFDGQSLPSCCFLRQETLLHIVSLHPGV